MDKFPLLKKKVEDLEQFEKTGANLSPISFELMSLYNEWKELKDKEESNNVLL